MDDEFKLTNIVVLDKVGEGIGSDDWRVAYSFRDDKGERKAWLQGFKREWSCETVGRILRINIGYCKWEYDNSHTYYDCFDTECKNSFIINKGTWSDNNMKYCCFCGKLMKGGEN